jgi:WD40 repeat protein
MILQGPSLLQVLTSFFFGHLQILIYSPDGRCLFKYLAYESGLGVKTVAWSPCGQFLAVGSYDQAVRTLNHLTWKTFAEFSHAAYIRSPCNAAIYKVTQSVILLTCYISTAARSKFTF